MNVLGLGLDIVAVDRVERLVARFGERALRRVLTDAECAYCLGKARPATHVAARLAAKEAAYKALARDQDARFVGWREVEVSRDDDGRPRLVLHGRAEAAARRLGVRDTMISLTHESTHGAAVAILLG
ncbi:MAG: holo-ACP synthase [Gemmatimonadota bacterium]|nr:holo-ACP synthase [Gemmatimonadota bacterium]